MAFRPQSFDQEKSLWDEMNDIWEPAAKRRRISSIPADAKMAQKSVRRPGRLPSNLPAPTKNAEKAREHRKREKEYKEGLEKKFHLVIKKIEDIKKVESEQKADIELLLKHQVPYLLSMEPIVGALWKSVNVSSDEGVFFQSLENNAGICLHVNCKGVSLELCASCQTNGFKSEFLREKMIDSMPVARSEPETEQEGKSNLFAGSPTAKKTGSGRLPSTLPAPTENAEEARKNRQKKKEELQKLEKDLERAEMEYEKMSVSIKKQEAFIIRLRTKIVYLKSIIENQRSISALLKYMKENLKSSKGICLHLYRNIVSVEYCVSCYMKNAKSKLVIPGVSESLKD
ncbi:uncharacterized protein LOC117168678 [Belonocnema kinseyi]|uniref:uncharacterized protein LOC117168678 n=1 Tax=Belonocnema kinseyi TaxID=2817044 RepID=UPI00143DC333|nr:uncharacterized protein LOC117168678 [Belonocnema kinseyi]